MNVEKAEKILQSLGNIVRVKIFKLLIKYDKVGLCSTGIAKELSIPQNTISFHLAKMKNADLVTSKKEGKNVIYNIKKGTFEKLQEFLFKDCCSKNERICEKII
ncbi:MAG: metalloregulator ArsR/SmtB family transcription factor [Rickettsiales bacterium]|nr:metalloregulator ArsR/SmtB family transcription factor [Rickettsiales bacterium]